MEPGVEKQEGSQTLTPAVKDLPLDTTTSCYLVQVGSPDLYMMSGYLTLPKSFPLKAAELR